MNFSSENFRETDQGYIDVWATLLTGPDGDILKQEYSTALTCQVKNLNETF